VEQLERLGTPHPDVPGTPWVHRQQAVVPPLAQEASRAVSRGPGALARMGRRCMQGTPAAGAGERRSWGGAAGVGWSVEEVGRGAEERAGGLF